MLEKRQDGSFRLKYANEQITMPDLRIGEYQIELNTLLTSSTFYIKTKGKWSTNFLFSAVVANPKGDVIVENEIDFKQSVYKLAILESLDRDACRFFHLPVVVDTMSKNLERSESSSLSFLMDIQGIDRLALLSVAGHLGYNYSENRQFKNEYLEIQSKMITLKEMAENPELMTDEPSIYSAQELELLNKYFLRNRLRMISRPVHAQYVKQLLLDWGGPKLLSKLQDSELNFKEELLGDCLREVKKFKEITKLGEALDADLKRKSPRLPEIMQEGHIIEHFKCSEFKEAVLTLKTSFASYFESREYSKENLGKLLSSLVERKRNSTKILKGLDQLLFPKTPEISITVKMVLLGKDDMLARLKQIE